MQGSSGCGRRVADGSDFLLEVSDMLPGDNHLDCVPVIRVAPHRQAPRHGHEFGTSLISPVERPTCAPASRMSSSQRGIEFGSVRCRRLSSPMYAIDVARLSQSVISRGARALIGCRGNTNNTCRSPPGLRVGGTFVAPG